MQKSKKQQLIEGKPFTVNIIFNGQPAKKKTLALLDELMTTNENERETISLLKSVIKDRRIMKMSLKLNFDQNG